MRQILRIVWVSNCLLATVMGIAAEPHEWVPELIVAAPEAVQAATGDRNSLYAISSTRVARYDRATGKRLAVSQGPATHLNSGFLLEGKIYCAHSNFPQRPERSEIKVLDVRTMELTQFHDFGAIEHGSLTWVVPHEDFWWCTFAKYGDENSQTRLVKFDRHWQEQGVWTYPAAVISDLGRFSISGGVWLRGELWVTGHDKPVIYRLRLPTEGHTLDLIDRVSVPFTGQGIAVDDTGDRLIGIRRSSKQIVVAKPRQE